MVAAGRVMPETHLALFNQQRDPEKVLLYGSYYLNDHQFWTKSPFFPLKPRQSVGDYLFFNYGDMHVNTWLATKNLLAQVAFSSDLKQSEDWDVLLRIESLGGKFIYSPKPCAVRNVDLREERLTTTTNVESQMRFLERNSTRLTPQSCALFEALVVKLKQPSRSRLKNLLTIIQAMASNPRLKLASRLQVVYSYFIARVIHKLNEKIHRKPAGIGYDSETTSLDSQGSGPLVRRARHEG